MSKLRVVDLFSVNWDLPKQYVLVVPKIDNNKEEDQT